MKATPLALGLALLMGATASAQISISIVESAANTYTITLTNDGDSFNLSGGNDSVSIGKGTGGPDFTVPGIQSYPSPDWALYPTNPDTTSYKTFQAVFNDPTYAFTSGETYDFVVLTDSAASSFEVGYVFELGNGGSSWVGTSEVGVSAVPEPATAGLFSGMAILLLSLSRRPRRRWEDARSF